MLLGRYDQAEELLRDCRQLANQCGMLRERDLAALRQAEVAWFRGNVDEAERRWNEALEMSRRDHVTWGGNDLVCLGATLAVIQCMRDR